MRVGILGQSLRSYLGPPDPFAEPEPGKFPYDLAAYLVGFAANVYASEADVLSYVKMRTGADAKFFDREDIQAVGFVAGGCRILVFRGTDSRKKWDYNFRMKKVGTPPRHKGFQDAWDAVVGDIREWLASVPEGGPLILSGHSLGGALATLAGYELAVEMPVRMTITFGSPRVGPKAFREAYRGRLANPRANTGPYLDAVNWRVVYSTDVVPNLPSVLQGYRHLGQVINVTPTGFFAPGLPNSRIETDRGLIGTDRVFDRIQRLVPNTNYVATGYTAGLVVKDDLEPAMFQPLTSWLGLLLFSSGSVLVATGVLVFQGALLVWADAGRHSVAKYLRYLVPRKSSADPIPGRA